ncbi:MAG TPA: dephospho-CoA kinase [Bryobacteraceae bacterium]|jgi:dephospho-CoA kinase|nr:dephospho-CoA kinase [Bryobacteraceae bacterium]
MLRVGLTGGLASGKTFVGHSLRDLGCYLIEADELGHQVLLPGAEAYAAVIHEFGDDILDDDRFIDRHKLGERVFGKPELLAKLSRLVHPLVAQRQQRAIAEIAKANPAAIVVVEAAILVETGSYKKFDKLIVVVCTPEQQMERALKRGAYTREEVVARLSRQLPLEEKLRVADYVIDTSGSKENTLEQVHAMYASLRSLSA